MKTTQSQQNFKAYKSPPKRVFRKMGLGIPIDGYVKVIAGFRFRWWVPDFAGPVDPVIVNARILRIKESTGLARKPGGDEITK